MGNSSLGLKILIRLLGNIFLLFAFFLSPWWFFAVVLFLLLFIFPFFLEGLLVALIYDIVFGLPGIGRFSFQFQWTAAALLAFLFFEGYLKRIMRY